VAAPTRERKSISKTAAFTELTTPEVVAAGPHGKIDLLTAPREQATYLLHIGAEVEHALMAQYLYAAYSLGGPHLDDAQQELTRQWKATILEIAREEMGHLATVENILTLIGGPLSFEREDYPIPEDLYPFSFELEPLTKRSLGQYVLAEMPNEKVISELQLQEEIRKIEEYVGVEHEKIKIHRVGVIYESIIALFKAPPVPKDPPERPPDFIASSDIQAESIRFQVTPSAWGLGYPDILIGTATDRKGAIDAITNLSVQGEGSTIKDLESSHFGKFLKIYREFPFEDEWSPAKNVARNPTTDCHAPEDRRIANKIALLWAGLFNLRYRMLLMYLAHAFRLEAPLRASGRTPRGLLLSWTFGEMYNLRSITEILMTLPLNDTSEVRAGPPFEMPYSLALGARDPDRWRLHRDLLSASQRYIEDLLKVVGGQYEPYLQGLHRANETALEQVRTLIGG
jgi:hypothetical protein